MKKSLLKVLLVCFSLALSAAANAQLQLNIVDGKTNKDILQAPENLSGITQDNIDVKVTKDTSKNEPQTWKFSIKNNDTKDRWIYLNWQLGWNGTNDVNELHYWGGRDDVVTGEALAQRPYVDGEMNATMLQAIYDDKNGVALALPPREIFSASNQSLIRRGEKYFLQLQIPLALSAGESDTFPIEIYTFAPRYGYLDALQKYFYAHPDDFNARKNIDPRAAGVGGSRPWSDLVTADGLDKIDTAGLLKASERARRFGTDWEWFYAPFRRTGDIYARDEFYDYEPVKPFNYFRQPKTGEEFRAFRHHLLENVDKAGVAPAFYVPSFLYSDVKLAEEQYPDAIIRKPDGSYGRLYTTPWVIGNDHEVAMYPWGNKFAEQSMKDAAQVVAENDIPAFAYDIMAGNGMPLFRGKDMKKSPRRAFDKDGEYVNTAVAIAKMADFTRSLEKDGKKVGLVGNTTSGSSPFLAARSDTLLMEQTPYYENEYLYSQEGASTALRYAAGHKAITAWSAWRLPSMLKTDEMTPEELREAYQGTADFMRLLFYRLGAYPLTTWSEDIPAITKMLPLLKEVVMSGWQAVPAVRGVDEELPSFIWTARYGNDLGSFITLGNVQKTTWNSKIVIDNDYLGISNYLFIAEDGGKVLSQEIRGRTTHLIVEIPPRETLVLRAVAEVPGNATGAAEVSWNDNGANGNLTIKSTFTPTKVRPLHSDWKLKNHRGQNWEFASLYSAVPMAQLLNFPYFNGNKTARIVLMPNASVTQQKAAQRIQDYFKFWGKYGVKPAQDLVLPIVKIQDEKDVQSGDIILEQGGDNVSFKSGTIYIGAKNVQESVSELLKTLDQKYFYTGVLSAGGADKTAMEKAGLTGKALK